MKRIKEINSFITIADRMATEKEPDNEDRQAAAYFAAMNWLLSRAGLRELTPLDVKIATEMYGAM